MRRGMEEAGSQVLSQFNVDATRTVLKRKDVSKGLRRIEGKHIPVCDHSAPLFAIAFDMLDKTALPELTRKAIWALNNASACVEKGEDGMFIKGIEGLQCVMGAKEKTTIMRQDAESGEMQILKEMNMQVRIHVAQSGDVVEHYAMLVVSSPLAFSLRKAVWNTLHTTGRGLDGQNADMRRACWNRLATHVRQGFVPSARQSSHNFSAPDDGVMERRRGMAGKYTEREMSQAYDSSVDWIRVSNPDSFTCLFNVHRAVDWVCKHFFLKHGHLQQMTLEGFGIMNRESEHVSPQFLSQCQKYDEDVEQGIALTNKKKKAPKRKKKKNGGKKKKRGEMLDDEASVEEEEEELLNGEEAPVFVSVPVPFQADVQDENDDVMPPAGYPACKIGMEVNMSKSIEMFPSYELFWSECKGFPTSVTLDVLKKSLDMEEDASGEEEECLTLVESDMIMKGETPIFKRPMLSGGDSVWGEQCRESLLRMEGDGRRRWEYQRKFVRLAFALGLTRASGSDVYDNKRVEAYGKFMAMGEESVRECKDTYVKFMENVGGKRLGCCVHEAMQLFTHVLHQVNHEVWHLRPDNLYLLMQLMTSDVQLCLNYFDSMIRSACNGIGGMLIVRDGGGSYRTLFHKDTAGHSEGSVNMGQVLSKKNGSGVDTCVSIYKSHVNLSAYSKECASNVEGFVELKRTTELGLLQECCNVIENPNTESARQIHTVKDTCSRKFSTELRAGNDTPSQSCMQAISWLVTRSTLGLDSNCFATTKENEKTKTRVSVEYRQVMFGYWVVCTNNVGTQSRERFKTLLTVSRSICSCTNAISRPSAVEEGGDENGIRDPCAMTCDRHNGAGFQAGRSLFFSNMCTCVVSAFLQWTGVLGRLPSSPVLEAVLDVFYAQLALCKDMLNPNAYVQGERGRCFQISKARGVAMSLIMTSMEQTLEAGRRGCGQQEAVEQTAQRLMLEGTSPHLATWIMADTLEHMFRMDFMLLLQMIGTKLQVPGNLTLMDVLTWLQTGSARHCAVLEGWLSGQRRLASAPHDKRVGADEIAASWYVTHADLSSAVVNAQGQVDTIVCSHVGSSLFFQNHEVLEENCQIHGSHNGEEIVQCMLFQNVNCPMRWPSVFGSRKTLPHFWMGGQEPRQEEACRKLILTPLRVVVTDARKASVFVDVRWLLLYCGLCGSVPSQSSRFLGISKWIQHFYETCIPDSMVCNRWLFTGLPSPVMDCGLLLVAHRPSGRRTLRRPNGGSGVGTHAVGLNAPIRTRVVEDLGPAALRYQMAEVLQVCERTIPTEAVSYSFPPGKWCPVMLEEGSFASLKWDERDRFVLKRPGQTEQVVNGGAGFLSGRVSVAMRPLCTLNRPGIAIMMEDGGTGVVQGYDAEEGAYRVWNGRQTMLVDPYAVEDATVPVGGVLYVRVEAMEQRHQYKFLVGMEENEEGADAVDAIQCTLGVMNCDGDEENLVAVHVEVGTANGDGAFFALYGASHGATGSAMQDMEMHVPVQMVLGRAPERVSHKIVRCER